MKKTLSISFAVIGTLILIGENAWGAIPYLFVSFLMYLNAFNKKKTQSAVVILSIIMAVLNLAATTSSQPSWVDAVFWILAAVFFTDWKELFN